MTPHEFIAKWQPMALSERASYVTHFNDLCDLIGHPKPLDEDPNGTWFTFEKGVDTSDGRKGWADVWLDQKFGWEYKGKHKDLSLAYKQLLRYRESLNNPPLLIVCDLNKFEIHTNFTGFAPKVYTFDLDGLKDPKNVQLLRDAFTKPEKLRPDRTQEAVTREIAERFAKLAEGLRKRGEPPDRAAHFLMKLMFCMFAEDIDLLPRGLFTETVAAVKHNTEKLSKRLRDLFEAMSHGGDFGNDEISHFNGGLFADADVIDLSPLEIKELHQSALCDWSAVEPSIFGTLFERCLDPDTRAPLGAHYTGRPDIETLLKPVIEAPLRREWETVRTKADKLFEKLRMRLATASKKSPSDRKAIKSARKEFDNVLEQFAHRLTKVTVLDPACGSGNFLYVALHLLLNLEKEVRIYAADRGLVLPQAVRPTQLLGLEKNDYAQQLAQEVIWIGFLQWIVTNGDTYERRPILDPLDSIQRKDAILDLTDPANPKEPDWPAAEFIVGNPPFLGDKKLRGNLSDAYVDSLHEMYRGRIPGQSDLCCYWFENAREMIESGRTKRAGLLATQGIRGGSNRVCLDRIQETGGIFFGISTQDWVLDGANVHIAMIGFDDGTETARTLDGQEVDVINTDLTSAADLTTAKRLTANQGIGFVGTTKKAPLDLPFVEALGMLGEPNPNRKPNSDVLLPFLNAENVTKRFVQSWVIDFGSVMTEAESSLYERPFQRVKDTVYPLRKNHREPVQKRLWWRLARPCPDLFQALSGLARFLVTPIVSKHRLFVWECAPTNPDHQLVVFAREDDYFFGVLQSRAHEAWALVRGTRHETRPRYTPSTCFESFPFPKPKAAQSDAIAAAAKELDTLRNNWLNPPEWTKTEVLEFPGSVDGPWKRYIHKPHDKGIGTVRYPRIVPKDNDAGAKLKKRALTNLYNERPAWLANAHRRLDEAVFAAYGWPAGLSDDDLLARLLALNLERGTTT